MASLAAVILALCLSAAVADPTTSLMQQLSGKRDPQGCGKLGRRCCLKKAAAGRCSGKATACVAKDGPQDLRCHACGDAGMPACRFGESAKRAP